MEGGQVAKIQTELFAVRLTPDERRAIEDAAQEHATSMGAVIRWAIQAQVMSVPPVNGRHRKSTKTPVSVSQADAGAFAVVS